MPSLNRVAADGQQAALPLSARWGRSAKQPDHARYIHAPAGAYSAGYCTPYFFRACWQREDRTEGGQRVSGKPDRCWRDGGDAVAQATQKATTYLANLDAHPDVLPWRKELGQGCCGLEAGSTAVEWVGGRVGGRR